MKRRFQVQLFHALQGDSSVKHNLFLIIVAGFLLVSCSMPSSGNPPTPASTPTVIPSPSPTVITQPLVILVIPADMPADKSDFYQTMIYDLAQQNGMRFQVRNTLTPADIAMEGEPLKVVIALPPDPGLSALAAAAPNVQFLAVGIAGLAEAPNLSTIGADGVPVDQQAFVAGYLAGMVTPEWRVGIMSQKDTPDGDAAVTAFQNGYHFYCGDCFNPDFPQPFYHGLYPVIVRLPTDTPERDYTGWANLLIDNWVKVAFIYPDLATSDLVSYMEDSGVQVISQYLPGDDLSEGWVASIQPDLNAAITNIFPDLVAGNGGKRLPTPLFLVDVNTNILSDAKLRLVQELLDGLQNGSIGTNVTP
jgi:hypothetical protein